MKKVIVIGGGAAGMMAAVQAAKNGAEVTLLEKMKRPGKKMLITGKGRCNITNSADLRELIKNMTGNGSFLYSAFHQFSNEDTVAFFEKLGVPTKVERGGRVFPVSDKAADVVGAMLRALNRLDVRVLTDIEVKDIRSEGGAARGVETGSGAFYPCDAVILATGGISYPATGSTGDGHKMAKRLGHSVTPLRPSLVPLEVEEEWVKDAQGLSLRNVKASVTVDGKKAAEEFGEMLFTHFGVSGPIILSLSRMVTQRIEGCDISLSINLKPALTPEMLDKRLQRDFAKFRCKQIKNSLHELLPGKLIPVVMDLAYLDPEKMLNVVTKEERLRLSEVIRNLTLTVTGPRPIAEAIVTAGGVSVKEINPKTMESKFLKGLFFAGELVDVDGYTGGYNLQAAFSTGFAAGRSAALTE